MKSASAFMADEPNARHLSHQLGARCVLGFCDQIGERVLVLDDQQAPAREILFFRETLTTTPGFEVALRRRVERLKHFQHPLFAATPSVEYLGHERSLALVSPCTPGKRLSDVLAHAQDPALATSLIDRLLPAIDALNGYAEGTGHGALTPSRVVISPDGQPIIIEHALGSALERLHLTPDESRKVLGIPLPPTESGRTDFQTDCFQLALIAISMRLGRLLGADDYPDLGRTLHTAMAAHDQETAVNGALSAWLSRALQLDGREFVSARDARAVFRYVAAHTDDDASRQWRALAETPVEGTAEPVVASAALLEGLTADDETDTPPAAAPPEETVAPAPFVYPSPEAPPSMPAPAAERALEDRQPAAADDSPGGHSIAAAPVRHDRLRWAVLAIAAVAIVEAIVIAMLLARRAAPPPDVIAKVNLVTTDPGAAVIVDGQSAGVTPLDLAIGPSMRTISVAAAAPKQELVVGSTGQQEHALDAARTPADSVVPAAAAPERVGGIRVSSPIPLDVFEGDRRLGSSRTGIVPAAAGRRELDLVNSVLGFKTRQVVDVRAGRTIDLTVTPPNGRININAVPWAEVLIAGKSVGETPIGNLSIPLGEHEIVFRHPQLGEVRRTAVVRLDAVTLVSVNLQR